MMASRQGQLVFPTAIGGCRIEWRDDKITSVKLLDGRALPARQGRDIPPPRWVRDVQLRLTRHLEGTMQDLSTIPLDFDGIPPFHCEVYRVALNIPAGEPMSYGQLAARAGSPQAARAVGQAMRRNPFPLVVPCHRVVATGGGLGGFSAVGGVATKRRLLSIEKRAMAEEDRARESCWPFEIDRARRHLRRHDPVLGQAIGRLGAVRFVRQSGRSPYRTLFRAIVYQQLHVKAASTILGRVLALYAPKQFPTPDNLLATPETRLRAAGLSRNKTAAVRDLSAKVLDGTVPSVRRLSRMDDETIIERLIAVHGIGRWTAEMFLISLMGRPDVMPVDDLGVRKGFGLVFGGDAVPAPGVVLDRAEAWRPYRTVATWYMWQAADSLLFK
jgi:methylated-DNA-[protein]-cysteine S-methyltransferase